jgi:hypothetical protein
MNSLLENQIPLLVKVCWVLQYGTLLAFEDKSPPCLFKKQYLIDAFHEVVSLGGAFWITSQFRGKKALS